MEAPRRQRPARGGLRLFDNQPGECRREYSTNRASGTAIPGGPCPQPARVILVALHLRCECRWDYSFISSWSRVRIPPGPPWACSSAVEHDNIPSPSSQLSVVPRSLPRMPARLHDPVGCRFDSGHGSPCSSTDRAIGWPQGRHRASFVVASPPGECRSDYILTCVGPPLVALHHPCHECHCDSTGRRFDSGPGVTAMPYAR